jgi:hypothetical protein
MKRQLIKLLLTGFLSLTLSIGLLAQDPPDPPEEHGSGDDEQPGGNAPLGAGVYLLLGLGAAYGASKFHLLKRAEEAE